MSKSRKYTIAAISTTLVLLEDLDTAVKFPIPIAVLPQYQEQIVPITEVYIPSDSDI